MCETLPIYCRFITSLAYKFWILLKLWYEDLKWNILYVLQVDYFNNKVICDLVEVSHKGILAILDEACLNVGKVTDKMFLEAMDQKLANHKHYTSRKVDFKKYVYWWWFVTVLWSHWYPCLDMVPTSTGKPGNMREHFPVREFWIHWKSQGILHKVLEKLVKFTQIVEKSENFRQLL